MRQPVVWGAAAVALAASGSRRGRQAALRGTITAASASALANLVVKPLVRRTRPAGALDHRSVPTGQSESPPARQLRSRLKDVLADPFGTATSLVGLAADEDPELGLAGVKALRQAADLCEESKWVVLAALDGRGPKSQKC